MPDKLKGLFLEGGAHLSAQGAQNLRTLTRGDLSYDSVKWALRQLDSSTRTERPLPGKAGLGALLAISTSSEETCSARRFDASCDVQLSSSSPNLGRPE
eukprot:2888838-Pyramimonas_sp.AAC.1